MRLLWDTSELSERFGYIISASFGLLQVLYQRVQLHHKSLHTSTATTSLNIDAKHTSIGYQTTLHQQYTFTSHFFNTLHVQNLQRATQSALASPHKRFSIADMLLQACYTFCRSDWQHLDTTIWRGRIGLGFWWKYHRLDRTCATKYNDNGKKHYILHQFIS